MRKHRLQYWKEGSPLLVYPTSRRKSRAVQNVCLQKFATTRREWLESFGLRLMTFDPLEGTPSLSLSDLEAKFARVQDPLWEPGTPVNLCLEILSPKDGPSEEASPAGPLPKSEASVGSKLVEQYFGVATIGSVLVACKPLDGVIPPKGSLPIPRRVRIFNGCLENTSSRRSPQYLTGEGGEGLPEVLH